MKTIINLLCVFSFLQAFAQNEASTCFFGNVGVDFRFDPPEPIFPISMISKESPASICDSLGNILFYTNGGNSPTVPGIVGAVWNANNAIMENGILGDSSGCISAFQGSIIVPFPKGALKSNDKLYYLFTVDCIESSFAAPYFNSGLTYAVIDMNQNGGLGKVVQKNVSLVPYSYVSTISTGHESVSAILHGNNEDYWLFAFTNDSICRLKITATGIEDFTMLEPGSGRILISPNREFMSVGKKVYQFNSLTGSISFMGTVMTANLDVTFSPDGTKLYELNLGKLNQYDLTQTNFLASKTEVGNISSSYKLWLAPNHKIYAFATSGGCFVAEIKCPNVLGTGCNLISQQTCFNGGSTDFECTNIMAHYLYYNGSCTIGIDELSPKERKLVKVVDLLGQETEDKPNTFLIRIYTDGTVEKGYRLE